MRDLAIRRHDLRWSQAQRSQRLGIVEVEDPRSIGKLVPSERAARTRTGWRLEHLRRPGRERREHLGDGADGNAREVEDRQPWKIDAAAALLRGDKEGSALLLRCRVGEVGEDAEEGGRR